MWVLSFTSLCMRWVRLNMDHKNNVFFDIVFIYWIYLVNIYNECLFSNVRKMLIFETKCILLLSQFHNYKGIGMNSLDLIVIIMSPSTGLISKMERRTTLINVMRIGVKTRGLPTILVPLCTMEGTTSPKIVNQLYKK